MRRAGDPLHFRTLEVSDPAYERDSLRVVTVKSPALRERADVSLWIPEARQIGTLLILLHGVYGSHWVWGMKGGAHRTARRLLESGEIAPMVIAMPSDGMSRDGSAYLKWPGAQDVERWITEEVPAIAHLAAPALLPDAKIGIAGLSMGGYGALRLGAKYARNFCAISAHSAITCIEDMAKFVEEPLLDYLDCAPREELDVLHWIRLHADELPPLRFDCGAADSLLASNRELHRALEREGIAHRYDEFSGGHDWSYWQAHLEETLRHVDQYSRL